MIFIRKIAEYKWLIISLIAAAGIGIFLFWQTHHPSGVETTAANKVTITNDAAAPDATPQAAPAVAENNPSADANVAPPPDQNVQPAPVQKNTDHTAATQPADAAGTLDIINRLAAWGFSVPAKPRSIDTIILHSNYNTLTSDPYSVSGAIQQFKNYDVAPHYLIDRAGDIFRLVPEKDIAFHAGVSRMPDGRTDVNNFSIGIEIITKETNDAPTAAEYAAVNKLIADIKTRYPIKYVLGHSQIAPGRKTDPWNFDWDKLK